MISKQRLQQLIEKGATIYVRNTDNVVGSIDFCEYEGRILKNCFQFRVKIKSNLSNYYGCEPNWSDDILLKNIFETKEDAEEYAEFGNIPRTEWLELPTWEEVEDIGYDEIFFVKDNRFHSGVVQYYFLVAEQTKEIQIMFREIEHIMTTNAYDVIFNEPLTRENYDKARRICVKLFKGEEV